jgi:hypothetical protein
VYCAKRALDESVPPATDALKGKSRDKAKGGLRTDEGDRLVKEIMEEVMANLGKGLIDTNIFSQPVSLQPRLGGPRVLQDCTARVRVAETAD